ncbi:AAA family ATPase [Geobacter hydrogenophilus]|uniref:Cobyrinic acid a,c-diamide synthase n=1 Tax=Geobacter hydrogenophilus TaxID=40983 RepID=A0A9W6FYN0_9BACT|nr:AAA family ATPase [Geobacter hydrogenophilus]MBT0894588.1 AAA family ATPase [Geobacter hydrogenophilus]GLI37217.1 cobyrinic acid a,c-diamide synthase [Geobacter hydrogenophilus]
MCKKVFIAATGMNSGKTTISVSLMHLARKKYGRVGFIKAIGPKCQLFNDITVDMDAALMARIFGLEEDIAHMSPVVLERGSTKRFIDGEIPTLWPAERITEAVRELERKNDYLIIEGSGHGGVGSVIGMNNAKVAKLVDAPVIMVSGGGIGNVIDSVQLNLPLYRMEGADLRMLLVNKLIPEKRETSLSYLQRAFTPHGINVVGAFDWSPILANPTLNNIARLLAHPLRGDQSQGTRIVHHIQLGAASSQKVIDGLAESTMLLVTSSRDELLVTLSSLYNIPAYREKIAGLVIPGHAPVSAITQKILDDSSIPYIRIHETTADIFSAMKYHVSKISAEDAEKIDLVKAQAEKVLDFDELDRMLS